MLQGVTTCKVGGGVQRVMKMAREQRGDAEDEDPERWDFEGHWNGIRKLSWGLTYVFYP